MYASPALGKYLIKHFSGTGEALTAEEVFIYISKDCFEKVYFITKKSLNSIFA